jgi:uncharacterized membrane protein YoaK (UPF0700 family)
VSVLGDVARTLWPAPGDRHGPLVPMMVALTVVSGMVDAASYLRLGHVFVANMTGNVIFLGIAAQRLAVPELTTTVLTRTLTGLASEAGLVGGRGSQLGRRSVAVAAMLLGALAGGLLALHVSVAAAVAVAVAIVCAVGLAVHVASRSAGAWIRH